MRCARLLLLAALAAAPADAQEVVALETRPGVMQPIYIPGMGKRKPEAAALLLTGGSIRLRWEDGRTRFVMSNFLPRSRREFVRNGILPVILDAPTERQGARGMNNDFRVSAEHAADVRAVAAYVRKRHPGLPLFLVGTGSGTNSAAHLAAAMAGEVRGVVLTATHFYEGSRNRRRPLLESFDWGKIRVPILFVHHEADACWTSPFESAVRVARQYPLVRVRGGKPGDGASPCAQLSAHGFYGKEAETVDAIAAWMLGKPYKREIR